MVDNKSRIGILKQKYRKVLESSLTLSMIIMAFLFYSFKAFENNAKNFTEYEPPIIVKKIPQTKQNKPKPPPSRPQIPVEADDDELLDDVTIDDTDIDFTEFSDEIIPPPAVDDEIIDFFAVSDKPVIVNHVKPIYPELARRAQIEGIVTIKVLIDTKGNVEKAEILKSIPMLNEAAMKAAMQCKFIPAKQRDKEVKVWMSIPFKFSLRSSSM